MVTGAIISWVAVAAIIPLAGVAIALAGFVWTLKRSEHDDAQAAAQQEHQSRDVAREEAIDLAQVRGQAISDLHDEVGKLRKEVADERDAHLKAVGDLQHALDLSRQQSLEVQQMLAHGMRGLLVWILGELESEPPRVHVAIRRIREALDDADPRPPGQRKLAA